MKSSEEESQHRMAAFLSLMYVALLIFSTTVCGRKSSCYYYLHSLDEETEAQ